MNTYSKVSILYYYLFFYYFRIFKKPRGRIIVEKSRLCGSYNEVLGEFVDIRVKMTVKLDSEQSFSSTMVPLLHYLEMVLQSWILCCLVYLCIGEYRR